MHPNKTKTDFSSSLFRFAWALTGDEKSAIILTQKIIGGDSGREIEAGVTRAAEVAIFSLAFRLFTGGEPMPIPPAHDRVAAMNKLSLEHASLLTSDSLLLSFRELELPQRAALVLFYTTQCSLHDIAAILRRSSDETVSILSRGKAEWLHILHRSGKSAGHLPEGGAK